MVLILLLLPIIHLPDNEGVFGQDLTFSRGLVDRILLTVDITKGVATLWAGITEINLEHKMASILEEISQILFFRRYFCAARKADRRGFVVRPVGQGLSCEDDFSSLEVAAGHDISEVEKRAIC